MTTVADIIAFLDSVAPFSAAAEWDPVGLQIGDASALVARVGICHEVTSTILDAISEDPPELLVTYHPLLFEPTRTLIGGASAEGRALALARMGGSLVVVHTAFDVADGGVADALAAALQLSDSLPFGGESVDGPGPTIGRIGISSLDLGELAAVAASSLGVDVRVAKAAEGAGQVVVVPGSGSDFIEAAAAVGASVLVTGDVSHHRAQAALALGLSVIDAGHVPTERPGMARLVSLMKDGFVGNGIDVVDLTSLDPHPWGVIDG